MAELSELTELSLIAIQRILIIDFGQYFLSF